MDLKEKGYNRRERMEWLVIMLVVSLLCMIPCMGKLLPQGDDMTFHILRIESVYHAIKTGQGFPAYIYDKLLEGYGYGAGIFYPDILLLPAILLRFMGLSPAGAMKGYIFLLLLLTCYTSYRAGKVIGKSHFVGLVTMVLYTMGHYHWKIYTDGRQWEKLSPWHSFLWYFWHCMIIQNGKNGEKGCYVWYFPVCCSVTRSASCYVLESLWYGCCSVSERYGIKSIFWACWLRF